MKKDYRCMNCKALLYKSTDDMDVEIICTKCRRVNYPNRSDQGIGLRGIDFQSKALSCNCSKCSRFMFMVIGDGEIEIKCSHCTTLTEYDTVQMRKGNVPKILDKESEKIRKSLAR